MSEVEREVERETHSDSVAIVHPKEPIMTPIYVVITILLLVVLIWIYFRLDPPYVNGEFVRQQKVNDTIQWLYRCVNDICYDCNMTPIYEIKENFQITYTEKNISPHNVKGTIYLVVWDDLQGRVFNHNTFVYAVLHEIAHILSPSVHHEPPFDAIENILLDKAYELSYYDPNIPIDPNYITLDLGTGK